MLVFKVVGIVAGALSAIGATLFGVSQADNDVKEPTKAQIFELSSEFDLPLQLPRDLPTGFEWADQTAVGAEDDSKHATFRTVMFHNDHTGDSVEICISRARVACDPRSGDLTSASGNYAIVIHFWGEPAPEARRQWEGVDFTNDLDRVSWLS